MQKRILMGENLELAAATLSCIGDGVISTDLEGRIIYMNQIAEEIVGWEAKKAIGEHFDKVFTTYNADTKKPTISPIAYVLENDTAKGLENNTIFISKENIEKYVSATCSPVKAADGSIIGVVIVFRDITRLKQLEMQHRNEEKNLKTVFNLSPVNIVTINENGIISHANNTALQLINKKKEEVIGKRFGDSFNCTGSTKDERGCGFGPNSPNCELRKAIVLAIKEKEATGSIELRKELIKDERETELWFKTDVIPIMLDGMRNAIVTLSDITENKKEEITLIKSRDYSNNLLDQIPSLVWKSDVGLGCNYVNKVWREFTGLTLEEASGFGWTDVIHPKDLDTYLTVAIEAKLNNSSYQSEIRYRRYDGEYRLCLVVGTPYSDLEGEFEGYIGLIYDITERKEIEEALIESEEKLRTLFNNTSDAIFLHKFTGEEGKPSTIIEVNDVACKRLGYAREELIGMSPVEFNKSVSYNKLIDLLNTAEINSHYTIEKEHVAKDGRAIPVEVNIHCFEIKGEKVFLSLVRDITERKKSEKKIQENQAKYRSLFMNMHSGYAYYKVVFNDKEKPVDLKIIEANEAFEKIAGISKKYLIGKHLTDLLPISKDIFAEISQKYVSILARGKSVYIEEIYFNSSAKWYSLAIYSPKKNHVVTIITDITRIKESEITQKKAKEAAEAANKAKSEFLANMSHEIRTPINGVVGMIDLTLLTELNDDQKDNLITAKTCADSLLNIINDILDFSKMEAGKLCLENVNFNIKEFIEEIVKAHSPLVVEKGLELNYTFSSTIPQFLVGDPHRLRQVLNNLISNAMKFTESGDITLSVKKTIENDNEVELKFTVTDTGIGIASQDLVRIFESFVQVDGSFTKKVGGTGLGLVIAKQLVEMMGGKIWVDSQIGKGSTFYFLLKFKMGSLEAEEKGQVPQITKAAKPLYILLVEDDTINQKVTIKMLKEKGHIVDTANNGKEALQLFKRGKYDVILMDIQMPEMDGIEVSKRIREMEDQCKHTPIIATTAHALQGDKEKFLNLGMDGYISKPIRMSELFYTLDTVISTHENGGGSLTDRVEIGENGEVTFIEKGHYKPDEHIYFVLSEVAEYIKEIESAMENGNLVAMGKIAHDIKSVCNEIDADELKYAAFKIELAVRRGNWEDVSEYVRKLSHKFKAFKESILSLKEWKR